MTNNNDKKIEPTFTFTVLDNDGEVIFNAEKPMLEMIEEEMARFENHKDEIIKQHESER